MPRRLLYSRDNRGQVAQDELSTRVKSGPASAQVPASCAHEPPAGRGCCFSCLFMFARVLLLLSPPVHAGEIFNELPGNLGSIDRLQTEPMRAVIDKVTASFCFFLFFSLSRLHF